MAREITYKEAISEALAIAMRSDENIIIMGEDLVGGAGKSDPNLIDSWGGPFGVTKGFYKEFGPNRIFDTPITENAFIGAAIGASMEGLRPIVELMYIDFMGVCFDHFLNQAGKQKYMFGGTQKNPITIRATYGCGWREGAHHSHVNYSIICHIPGWYVLAPSNPSDMKGGLLTAIRNDSPIIVFEHRLLYDKKGPVEEGDFQIPLGKGKIKRAGKDLTLVAIGNMVPKALNVAEKMSDEGISVEVIDPIWLSPFDEELIIDSLKKTGRIMIVDEDNPKCSMASEIAAIIGCKAVEYLSSPIQILCSPNTPVPFSPVLEDEYMITESKIETMARKALV